jgi:hypothetical protein
LQTIIDKKYTNLYYTDKDYQYIDMKKYLNKGYDITNINKNHVVPGFTTSKKTRPLIIEKLELLCADKNEPLKIRSKRLIDELFVFS